MDLEKNESQLKVISALMTLHIVDEVFEEYSLAEAPDDFFSGLIFSLIAKYTNAKKMTPDEAVDFTRRVSLSTIETLEKRKENNENS